MHRHRVCCVCSWWQKRVLLLVATPTIRSESMEKLWSLIRVPCSISRPKWIRLWVRFCNRKDELKITNNSGICEKHFGDGLMKDGCRKTLRWELNPAPTKYSADIDVAPSVLPTPLSQRKPPTDRSSPDELKTFRQEDEIKSFVDISDALCPVGYQLEVHHADKKAIFYKMEKNSIGIPNVTETIVLDEQLHVKLYKNSLPIPLPTTSMFPGGEIR